MICTACQGWKYMDYCALFEGKELQCYSTFCETFIAVPILLVVILLTAPVVTKLSYYVIWAAALWQGMQQTRKWWLFCPNGLYVNCCCIMLPNAPNENISLYVDTSLLWNRNNEHLTLTHLRYYWNMNMKQFTLIDTSLLLLCMAQIHLWQLLYSCIEVVCVVCSYLKLFGRGSWHFLHM